MSKNESQKLKCLKCPTTFIFLEVLEMHIEMAHPELSDPVEPPKQIKEQIPGKRKIKKSKIPCQYPGCDTGHAESSDQVHGIVVCPQCGKTVKRQRLSQHAYRFHSEEKTCSNCTYTTTAIAYMRQHFKYKHTERLLLSCAICGKMVKNIKAHIDSSSCGQREKTLKCLRCNRKFFRRKQLDQHIRSIHDKVKDKHCPECAYTSYSSYNLRLHVTKVHDKTTMIKICPHCKKKTGSLEKHISIYHSAYIDNNI